MDSKLELQMKLARLEAAYAKLLAAYIELKRLGINNG